MTATAQEFTIHHLAPETLTPNPANFRRHPEIQREALRASLEEHGYLSAPILNVRSGNLLDGHARVELAIENGEATIPVRVIDVSEAQERRILAQFDRIGSLAEEDPYALTTLLQELAATDEGLPAGWGESDLDELLAGMAEVTAPEEFPEVDENLATEHQCPKCGYQWAGKSS